VAARKARLMGRRALVLAAAVTALGAAVLLLVLGLDVLRWRGHLEGADLRFAAATGNAKMWEPDTTLPAGVTRSLLAVEDDLHYRRTVQLFRLSRLGLPARDLNDVARRGRVERELARLDRTDDDAGRRSLAANLQGVLAFEEARESGGQSDVLLRRSLDGFRRAISLDRDNEDAKYNLELVLRLLQSLAGAGQAGDEGRGPDTPASGAGAATQGSGY
jgi:hypothetical protein